MCRIAAAVTHHATPKQAFLIWTELDGERGGFWRRNGRPWTDELLIARRELEPLMGKERRAATSSVCAWEMKDHVRERCKKKRERERERGRRESVAEISCLSEFTSLVLEAW
jgi:hypothetical protein